MYVCGKDLYTIISMCRIRHKNKSNNWNLNAYLHFKFQKHHNIYIQASNWPHLEYGDSVFVYEIYPAFGASTKKIHEVDRQIPFEDD